MATAFELTTNFSAKLEFDLSKKADGALGCSTFTLFLGFIEHLMI